jgi:nitroreductase
MNEDPGLFRTMYSARALRRFKPDPVPDEVLFQLFDAAIRAPSGQNAQDWRFIILRERAVMTKLQEWALEGWARYEERVGGPEGIEKLPKSGRLSMRSVEYLTKHLHECPVIVCVLGMKGRHSTPGGSTFPAVQNLLLSAAALGLGASIYRLAQGHPEELREMLAIPENNELYAMIPLGYPLDRHGPLRRKPVKAVVYDGRFGEPWAFAEGQPEEGWQAKWLGE